ncbi:MAG: hypothetical protein OXU35_03385 [Acidobacteriota bacterium]|nr:hypothetical protein [Acidobacteriota bacterium]MDE2971328.1 hypothetical protein [Acidobacteriota bacterium]MDE3261436.1 hypothetical protein [Acidobacteriota bacterium]
MSIISRDKGRALGTEVARVTWRSLQVAAAIAIVVVPFGYAVTGANADVLMGALAGLTVGIGLNLRMGRRNGRSIGILIGSAVGVATALIAGLVPGNPWGALVPPVLALSIGLTDGLGETRIRGYREALAESALLSGLLGAGLLFVRDGLGGVLGCAFMIAPNALYVGFFNRDREGKRYSRPPLALVAALPVLLALLTWLVMNERTPLRSVDVSLISAFVGMVVVPIPIFLAARTFAIWVQPRLRLYVQLADYLRVMWVPIGGFAVGYLAIIVIFAGFFGMLERFLPGSFSGAAEAGVLDWTAFSFYSAIADPSSLIRADSGLARFLVGTQLVFSIGWALVVFAAVMSAIQPQLDAISRRRAENGD